MALAAKKTAKKNKTLDEKTSMVILKANLTEDDINDLFYTPGIALLEQKQYMAAAAMFLQAKNICDSKQLLEPALRYSKYFTMAKGLADKDVQSNTNESKDKKQKIEETPIFKLTAIEPPPPGSMKGLVNLSTQSNVSAPFILVVT
jgi:hypothetical protein